MNRAVTLAALLVCLPAFAQKSKLVETSVCAIDANPSKFHNKNIRVRGTASSGMEASILIDTKDGKWKKECGRINLDFDTVGNDESTSRFMQLFGVEVSAPKCPVEEEVKKALAHALDPKAPEPIPCFDARLICLYCPRYSIVATFTGKLRYSEKEPGHARFGHLGMFALQLDVATVSDLDVTDTQAASRP